jgi:hypothetical protein
LLKHTLNGQLEFVATGIGEEGILREVKGQTILGENAFSEKLLVHVKDAKT